MALLQLYNFYLKHFLPKRYVFELGVKIKIEHPGFM